MNEKRPGRASAWTAAVFCILTTYAHAQVPGLGALVPQFDVNTFLRTARAPDRTCERLLDAPSSAESAAQLGGLIATISGQAKRNPNAALTDKRIIEAAKHLLWVPITYEELYGSDQHRMHLAEGLIREPDESEQSALAMAEEVLQALVAQLPPEQPYTFRLSLSTEHVQNAVALPGGYIYITWPALEQGRELVAILLAHELAHVTKRHESRRLQAKMVDKVETVQDLIGLLRQDAQVIERMGRQVQKREKLGIRFSVNQELEADACAVRLLSTQADIDVRRSVTAFLNMIDQEGGHSAGGSAAEGAACRAFGECHPSYQERRATMTSMIGRSAADVAKQRGSPDAAQQRRAPELMDGLKGGLERLIRVPR